MEQMRIMTEIRGSLTITNKPEKIMGVWIIEKVVIEMEARGLKLLIGNKWTSKMRNLLCIRQSETEALLFITNKKTE